MQPSHRYRVAVLSVVKHDYVVRGLAAHPRLDVVVVADDPQVPAWAHERNQLLADEMQVPYVRDVERALGDYRADIAVVCSEASRHCDLSVRAAQAGVHVVQDKPLSTRRSEAERLVEAVHNSDIKFMMWNRNCLPAILHAQAQIAAGSIGRVVACHVDFYFAKDAGPPKGTRTPGYPPIDWQTYQIAAHINGSDGGLGPDPIGELQNEGIYPLAFLLELAPASARRVFATSTAHFHQVNTDNGVEDLAALTIEFEGGMVGSIALGRIGLASHPSGGETKLRVVGSSGALVVHEARPDVGIYYRNQPPGEPRQQRVGSENDFLLADRFVRALDENRQPMINVDHSMQIFRTVEAALHSCRSGRPVDVES